MADNINDNSNDEESIDEIGSDKSFVGKFVSGLINNTPLSKWFKNNKNNNDSVTKPVIRRRGDENYNDEDEEDAFLIQPPMKRPKLPSTINDIQRNNFTTTPSKFTQNYPSNNNNVKVFNSFLEPIPGPSGTHQRKLFINNNNNPISSNNSIEQNDTDDSEEESTSGYSSSAPLKASIIHERKDFNKNNKTLNKEDLNAPEIANINNNNKNNSRKTSDINSRTSATIRSLFNSSHDGNRSLFSERSLNPNINRTNISLSSRRPNFNPSILGTPNFVDKTLTTSRILNSPFYNGRTMYGGSSSLSLTSLNKNITTTTRDNRSASPVVIQPINKKLTSSDDNITLSKTARRILNTLEQYSTPISDAKKIPISPKNDDKIHNNKSGILSKYIGANPYLLRTTKSLPSNKELQVPHLLQMKQKERLQNSTENVRQIAIASKSDLNKEEYRLPIHDNNDRTNEKQSKHVNKIKNNLTSVRQNKIQIEQMVTINDVELPNVSLPIKTLPKFDFVIPPPQTQQQEQQQVDNKVEKTSPINTSENNYEFSKPVVISENFKTIQAINCFKFSEPVNKKHKITNRLTSVTNNFKMPDNTTKLSLSKSKNNGENCVIKPAPELITTGSCIDILKNSNKNHDNLDKFKPNKNTWECQACLVRNDNDKNKCMACEMEREKSVNDFGKNATSFGDKFKPSATTWECPTCMIRNKNELNKCEACQTDNPNHKKSTTTQPTFNFGIKSSNNDTWECSSCWIRNKNDVDKCVACQSVRDKLQNTSSTSLEKQQPQQQQFNFGDKFKLKALQTWECPTCMIRNKNDLSKCEACETLKPGMEQSKSTFSFGIPTNSDWECKSCKTKNTKSIKCNNCGILKETNNVGFGDVFKLKQSEWECTSCLVRNKNDLVKCACCGTLKPGCNDIDTNNITTEKTTVTFNFGIDNKQNNFKFGIPTTSTTTTTTSEEQSTSSAPSFIFGNPTTTTTNTTDSKTTNGFSFGIKSQSESKINENNQKVEEKTSETVSTPSFKFGVDSGMTISKNSETTDKFPKKIEIPASLSADGLTKKPTFEFKPVNGDINKPNMFTTTPVITTTTTSTTNNSKAENIFGSKQSVSRAVTTSSPTFKFGSNPSISSTTTVPTATTSTTIITTAASVTATTTLASTTNTPSGIFKFGSANIQSSAISSTKRSFGDVSSSSPSGGKKQNKAHFSNSNGFGSTTVTTTAATTKLLAFELPKTTSFGNTDNKSINFGGNASKSVSFGTPTTSSSSGFGSMTNENKFNTSVDSSKTLSFGTPDNNKPLGTFSFSNTDANKTINFGGLEKSKTVSFGGNSEQKPVTGFGLNNNSSFATTNETKTTTVFGTNESNKPTGFGNLSNSKPVFGVADTKPIVPGFHTSDSKLAFGTAPSTSKNEPKPNIFPNTDMKSASFAGVSSASPKPSVFGATEPIKPFSFGSPATTTNSVAPITSNEPKPASFTFGQQQQQQSSENKLNEPSQPFKFGTSDTNNTSNTSGFNFSMTSPLPNTTFNFGSGTKTETTTATIQPAQNQGIFGGSTISNNNNNSSSGGNNNSGASWAKTGSFNFGTAANNNNQKAIFTFGASQTNQTNFPPQQSTTTPSATATVAPQPTTGFNFGTSTQPSVSTGSFSFTGPMPTFNFTEGASNTAQPQRKLRKALRRIHR